MEKEFVKRLTAKILLQAVKDYINPAPVLRDIVKRYNKDDDDYASKVETLYAGYRKKTLKEMRSEHMQFLTDGKSLIIADKLEKSDLVALKRKMKEEEKRIEFEEQLSKHKFDYKVESFV